MMRYYVVGKPDLTHLVSKLNVRIQPKKRPMRNEEGPTGRLKVLRHTVSALIKHERIEVSYHKGDEARGYMERLISEAIRFGDNHRPTMDLATFWALDEALVPKIFKVLVPRYKEWPSGLPYTRMLKAPRCVKDPTDYKHMLQQGRDNWAVLELRGNPYPPLPGPFVRPHPGAIHNVLLEEARKEYFRKQSNIENQAEQACNALPVPEEESCLPEHPSGEPGGIEDAIPPPR
jgi:large subunit ribosomal protein L17